MTDPTPTTDCSCTVPSNTAHVCSETPQAAYVDLLSTDTIVVLLRCPQGGCDAALFGPYGSRAEHGPGPLHTLIPAPSGAESSTIATPSPADVDYQVLWQNAMDRAADEERRGRIADATVARVEALADEIERNDCTCECCRDDETPHSLRAALRGPDHIDAEVVEEDGVDELLGNEISFTPRESDGGPE